MYDDSAYEQGHSAGFPLETADNRAAARGAPICIAHRHASGSNTTQRSLGTDYRRCYRGPSRARARAARIGVRGMLVSRTAPAEAEVRATETASAHLRRGQAAVRVPTRSRRRELDRRGDQVRRTMGTCPRSADDLVLEAFRSAPWPRAELQREEPEPRRRHEKSERFPEMTCRLCVLSGLRGVFRDPRGLCVLGALGGFF
jgi:hypothetical protein